MTLTKGTLVRRLDTPGNYIDALKPHGWLWVVDGPWRDGYQLHSIATGMRGVLYEDEFETIDDITDVR